MTAIAFDRLCGPKRFDRVGTVADGSAGRVDETGGQAPGMERPVQFIGGRFDDSLGPGFLSSAQK
jgi:hypothetical protein